MLRNTYRCLLCWLLVTACTSSVVSASEPFQSNESNEYPPIYLSSTTSGDEEGSCQSAASITNSSDVIVGAQQMERYLPMLEGRKVGVLTNHTGQVGHTHLVDTLLSRGITIQRIFAPEHGFRGEADAGESVVSYRDQKTGIEVVSLYGNNKRPQPKQMEGLDVVVFDIQDVGLRFYTYLSSMHYMMEACAENNVLFILLDRPNPNGFYVDGPILEDRNRSFVGMHPIPIVHGMTLGELARMINGERWLRNGEQCALEVIPCLNYTHQTRYTLPVKPSPNLPNMRSIYLYGSLCYFEGTPVSVGRGTDAPFQIYGHPKLQGNYSFTPQSNPGAKNPPLRGVLCHGEDLRQEPSDSVLWREGINLEYLIECYRQIGEGDGFFLPIFDKLTGVSYVREMIIAGAGANEIKEQWKGDVEHFLVQRQSYLLYDD